MPDDTDAPGLDAAIDRLSAPLPRSYDHVLKLVCGRPWALHRPVLTYMDDLVHLRAEGGRLAAEDIAERLAAARAQQGDRDGTNTVNGVRIIPMYGLISQRTSLMAEFSGGTSVDGLRESLRQALGDPAVNAIVLDVDSPGGSVDGITELASEIRDVRQAAGGAKPIVAQVNTLAASAAYWLAAQTDEIVVTPSGEVGSIGVYTAHQDVLRALEAAGVTHTFISAGPYKVEANPYEPLGDEAKSAIQEQVDAFYSMFLQDVAAGRSRGARAIDATKVADGYGGGRTLLAKPALAAGMVDRIATLSETVQRLAPRATRSRASAAVIPIGVAARAAVKPDREWNARVTKLHKESTVKIDIASLRGLDAHKAAFEELGQRLAELEAELAGKAFTEDQKAEFEQILEDRETLGTVIEELTTREAAVAQVLNVDRAIERPAAYTAPNVVRVPDDIFDLSAYRERARSLEDYPRLLRDGAMRVVENMDFPTIDRAKGQADLARILAKHRDDKYEGSNVAHGKVASRIIGTSSPLYAEAYAAAMTNRPLNPRMQAVLQTYSDSDGGVAVPVAIDPTFINVSDGTVNPLRDISRVETTTAKTWQATTTAGVTAAYAGERTTTGAADGAPSDIDGPTATPVRADVALDVSMEYLADYGASQLLAELGTLVTTAKDDLEADKFFTGDGTGEPEGITAAIITDTTSVVTTITNDTFALGDLDKLIAALGPRFRSRATMTATLPILQLARAFATAAQPGDSVYDQINGKLRGYPARENTAMDVAATDAKYVVLFGAFGIGFVIVDRLGLATRVVDGRDTNGRPTGNSVIYAAWRNTSKVLSFNAFRLLKIQ